MEWLRIGINTKKEAEDIISEVLMSTGANGVLIEGDDNFTPQLWDYLDESVLQKVPFCIYAYFPCDKTEHLKVNEIRNKIAKLKRMDLDVPLGSLELSTLKVKEADWENAWKVHFKPVRVSDYVVIKPTWEEYISDGNEIVVEIDPGMAFGTGNHETTRMCVGLLEEFVDENAKVLDVGCGSGILSVVASKLGAKEIVAVDIDSVAVEVTKQNARLNNCLEKISVHQSDLLSNANGDGDAKYDIVIANILADVIIKFNETVENYLNKNAMYICSGIIEDRLGDVMDSLKSKGFRIIKIVNDGEWRAIACKYKG